MRTVLGEQVREFIVERILERTRDEEPGTGRVYLRQHENVRFPPPLAGLEPEIRSTTDLIRLAAQGKLDEYFKRTRPVRESRLLDWFRACQKAVVVAAWEISGGTVREMDPSEFDAITPGETRARRCENTIVDFWIDPAADVVHIEWKDEPDISTGRNARIVRRKGRLFLKNQFGRPAP